MINYEPIQGSCFDQSTKPNGYTNRLSVRAWMGNAIQVHIWGDTLQDRASARPTANEARAFAHALLQAADIADGIKQEQPE
jgi:hypothetical protein